jgi:hypothetical protein
MMARRAIRWLFAGIGVAAGSYAAYAATAWYRYGRIGPSGDRDDRDALLDRFMPFYEVAERHHVEVNAPAAVVFEAASNMYLQQSPIIRAIFKAREFVMGSHPPPESERRPFLAQMRDIGWGVLAEEPGREVVMGSLHRSMQQRAPASYDERHTGVARRLRKSGSALRLESKGALVDHGRPRRHAARYRAVVLAKWHERIEHESRGAKLRDQLRFGEEALRLA